MSNMDAQEYSYETFDAAYNADPVIANIVDNYNGEEIIFQKEKRVNKKSKGSDVKQMAKRATDLKDLN